MFNLDKTERKQEPQTEAVDEYVDQLKRLQAEFENYVKRVDKERAQMVSCASEKIILKLLNIYDDLERAIPGLEGEGKKGVEMIAKNLWKILEEEGVKPIKAQGEKFDPYKHEVLMKEGEGDNVIQELQKGYMLKDKVIRHTKVKIGGQNGKDNRN